MTTIELGPLRLTEVAGIRELRGLPAYAPDAPLEDWKKRDFWLGLIAHGKRHAKVRDEAFRYFSEFGGYPLCHSTTEKDVDKIRQQVISEVITKTIEHDPGHRPHAPALDSAFVREVFRMVCRYAGQSACRKRAVLPKKSNRFLATPVAHPRLRRRRSDFLADSLLLYPRHAAGNARQGAGTPAQTLRVRSLRAERRSPGNPAPCPRSTEGRGRGGVDTGRPLDGERAWLLPQRHSRRRTRVVPAMDQRARG